MEMQYTTVHDIIAQAPILYVRGLLNGLVFASNCCNLNNFALLHLRLLLVSTRVDK